MFRLFGLSKDFSIKKHIAKYAWKIIQKLYRTFEAGSYLEAFIKNE